MTEARRPSLISQSFFQTGDLVENYLIGEVIGKGNYAEVRVGKNKKTGEKVAIKVLEMKKEATADIMNEIDILARVDDHPNVIQLKEIYERKGRMFLIMELVTGGELFDRIIARKHFSERDARDLMHVLFTTIHHMHSHGIVHRDLKPENILYATPDPNSPIKIADFGLAKLWMADSESDQSELKTLCGTPGYVAPEVLKNRKGYTAQCDAWSLGVILYILLCGYPPFQSQQQTKLFRQILKAEYEFHSPWWDNVSDLAKDLVGKLLVVDPEKRLTPLEALSHPWMLQDQYHGASVDMIKLKEYVLRSNKRKFRMLTNAISVARRLSLQPEDSPRMPSHYPSLLSLDSSRLHTDRSLMAPPPPPPLDPDHHDNTPHPHHPPPPPPLPLHDLHASDHSDDLQSDVDFRRYSESDSGRRASVDSDWLKARQESIARRSHRADELKKKKLDQDSPAVQE